MTLGAVLMMMSVLATRAHGWAPVCLWWWPVVHGWEGLQVSSTPQLQDCKVSSTTGVKRVVWQGVSFPLCVLRRGRHGAVRRGG